MKYKLIILGVIIARLGYAQSTLPDSIQQRNTGSKQDSGYVARLNDLATDYLKNNPALFAENCVLCNRSISKVKVHERLCARINSYG